MAIKKFKELDNDNITIDEFLDEYYGMYDEIYECEASGKEYPNTHLAIWAFDEWIKKDENKEILKEILKARYYDPFTSDRECAAFMLTLDKLGLI